MSPWNVPINAPSKQGAQNSQCGVEMVVDGENGHDAATQSAHDSDRQIDLGHDQHEEQADGNRPDGGDLQRQVGEVGR